MQTLVVRKITKSFFEAVAMPFVFLGISPHTISFLSLLMSIFVFYFVSESSFIFASIFIFLNGFFDVLDGTIARLTNKSSGIGTLVDRTIDKISEAVIFSSFIIFGFVDLKLGLYVLSIVLIATMIASNIEILLGEKLYAPLLVHLKFLKIFRFMLIIIFTAFGEINLMFFLVAIIATYSIIIRLMKIRHY